ncbi:condensation domain-containing protein [Methanogenium organophilum]|uniref:Condensation domain-containing protein n=1 Tax=Methanogenium organophilum TaxID=2199 RepID=A0A9X9T848_METOG|nr:condensation domain-containing protein [Methanogenium organophilum]WAI02033.1 condensation domain-containing protein [Methanogenium organophilum]
MTFPSSRPAPAFDLFNVYFERIYDPTMHLVFAFDGELDEDILRTATRRLLERDPYLRSRFAEGDGMPRWEETPETEWGRAFVYLPENEEEDRMDANAFPPTTPPAPLDVRCGPQLRITLSRETEGDRVTVTCHHGFCDAGGLRDLARTLFTTYGELLRNPDFRPAPTGWYDRSMHPFLSRFTEEEKQAAQENEEPFVDRWRFPTERTGRGTPRIASRTLSPDRLRRAKAFGKEHGATINDIMIGACYLAFHAVRNDPEDCDAPRSLLTSADLRRHLTVTDRTEEFPPMNLSVAYEVTVTAGGNARLKDVIGQVTAITRKRKAEGAAMGLGCILFYEEICAGGMPAVRQFFDTMMEGYETTGQKNPVFSNIGIFREDEFLPLVGRDGRSLGLTDVCLLPCVCWPYGFLICLSTYRDAMRIVVAYEEGPYLGETVERFLAYVEEYLPW